MMRPLLQILALSACLSILFCACRQDETPSYVGVWRYESSTPDLGSGYIGSYVEVDRRWNYAFYDAATGQKFSGTAEDFAHDGMVVTLTASNDEGTRVFVCTLKYLKEDRMIVESSSVNGTLTEISFIRDRRSS